MLRLWVLVLPLVAADLCTHGGSSILTCQNFSLEQLPSFYKGETFIRLENVTGNVPFNVSGLENINSVFGRKVRLNQAALASVLALPSLSTLDLTDSIVQVTDASNIFTNDALRTLRLIGSLASNVQYFKFTELLELDLSLNQLVTVPKIDGDRIVYLNLSSTGIRQVANLESLPDLEELDLSGNGLRFIDENVFADNDELEKLWLQNNNLQNLTLNAPDLLMLNLANNNFLTFDGEMFGGVSDITNLNMAGNGILEMKDPFKHIPDLAVLDLSNNEISVLNGSWFESATSLEVLRLSHNDLLELPALNKYLHNLHNLNLSNNAIQTLNGDFFKKTPKLAVLDVTHNQLKSIDSAMASVKELNKLYAAYNYLQLSEKTFEKALSLNFVNVSHNGINVAAKVFNNAPALRNIDLSYNDIDVFCIDAQLPQQIETLHISFNKLTSLRCLTNLSYLDVEGNSFACDLSDSTGENSTTASPDTTLSKSEIGDWREVYKRLCPTKPLPRIVVKSTTEGPQIMHDITESPSVVPASADDDYDDDDDDEDSGDEDDDSARSGQSQRESIDDLDMRMKNIHDAQPLATWAFALLGVCLVLLLINLLMFVWYRRRERIDARLGSDRPYEQLHNEVYKNTTTRLDQVHRAVDIRNYFSGAKKDKLNHIIMKLGLRNEASNDTESQTRMISSDVSPNQIA